MDLFGSPPIAQPLAARLRAASLDEYVGQEHLLGKGKPLREALEQGAPHSMIFWGPPGVGKTTLARLLAQVSDAHFETLSAVLSGVKEIRQAVEIARQHAAQSGRRTILFVDEVHRFNKSQQDLLLPDVEEGVVRLIGATTHNPGFYVNPPLLSRSHLFRLEPLAAAAIAAMPFGFRAQDLWLRVIGAVMLVLCTGALHALWFPRVGPVAGVEAGLIPQWIATQLQGRFGMFTASLMLLCGTAIGAVVAADEVVFSIPGAVMRGLSFLEPIFKFDWAGFAASLTGKQRAVPALAGVGANSSPALRKAGARAMKGVVVDEDEESADNVQVLEPKAGKRKDEDEEEEEEDEDEEDKKGKKKYNPISYLSKFIIFEHNQCAKA